MSREAMEMALNALTAWDARGRLRVIEALRTALAQPEKEWVGLTDEEIQEIYDCSVGVYGVIKESEAKLKGKNA